jgi:hypothetical protein
VDHCLELLLLLLDGSHLGSCAGTIKYTQGPCICHVQYMSEAIFKMHGPRRQFMGPSGCALAVTLAVGPVCSSQLSAALTAASSTSLSSDVS